MTIVPYSPKYWEMIQTVHDAARMQELSLTGLEAAFLPLSVAAEREDLFAYTIYVALEGNEAVGFVAYTEEELAWLYVHPRFQRRGIGRELACFALEQMQSEAKSVEVLVGNEPARKLYRSLGFVKEEMLHGHMPGNEDYEVSVWQMHMA